MESAIGRGAYMLLILTMTVGRYMLLIGGFKYGSEIWIFTA